MRVDVTTVRTHHAYITGEDRIPIRDSDGRLILPESLSWASGEPEIHLYGTRILDDGTLGMTDSTTVHITDLPNVYRQPLLNADHDKDST